MSAQDEEEDFYDAQSEASQIKSRIVTKYFKFWTRVMLSNVRRGTPKPRLAYVDLYCGPGCYKDGSPSTPVLILTDAVNNPDLCEMLVTLFNDKEKDHTEALEKNIGQIPGIEKLTHKPGIMTGEVDEHFEEYFSKVNLVPTFTFVDPFGYKGVTLKLLQAMLKDWGCDLVLFFSYNRINAALTNDIVEDHVEALFGKERLAQLREALNGKRPTEREALILESFSQAIQEMGFKYVLPFTFVQPNRNRTSHYLIFVCKNSLGYKVMKDIMAAESSEFEQGVASFGYSKSLSEEQTPLLFELSRPLDELGQQLLDTFAGETLTMEEVFNRHNVGTPFVKKNYKDVLTDLEEQKKIVTQPTDRPKRKGRLTFADDVRVTFPKKGPS